MINRWWVDTSLTQFILICGSSVSVFKVQVELTAIKTWLEVAKYISLLEF